MSSRQHQGSWGAAIVFLISLGMLRVLIDFNPIAERIDTLLSPIFTVVTNATAGPEATKLANQQEVRIAAQNDQIKEYEQLFSSRPRGNVVSRVIRFDVLSVRKHLWIDSGFRQGIAIDDPVLKDGFLIGVVDEVFNEMSRVQLIGDSEFRLNARSGIAHGVLQTRSGSILFTEVTDSDAANNLLYSDGLGGRVRPGLPIGLVGANIIGETDILNTYQVRLGAYPYNGRAVTVEVTQ